MFSKVLFAITIALYAFIGIMTCSLGNGTEITTPDTSTGTVSDYDGNVYKTIKIGNQLWMVENLKTTKYNDGQVIPNVTGVSAWGNLSTPGYCWYDNNPSNKDAYGGLYNWYAVSTGKLAPKGWHIPTDAEWKTLAAYLGGEEIAGGKMKTTTQWWSPNTGATNESGFTAIPVPYRNFDGVIVKNMGDAAYFWSSDSFDAAMAMEAHLVCDIRDLRMAAVSKNYGRSIRCIKD